MNRAIHAEEIEFLLGIWAALLSHLDEVDDLVLVLEDLGNLPILHPGLPFLLEYDKVAHHRVRVEDVVEGHGVSSKVKNWPVEKERGQPNGLPLRAGPGSRPPGLLSVLLPGLAFGAAPFRHARQLLAGDQTGYFITSRAFLDAGRASAPVDRQAFCRLN